MSEGGGDAPANGEFIGRLGHELRTPLNAILGFSTLLQREQNLAPRQREWLATVESSGRQLLARIDRLLELADIAPGRYGDPGVVGEQAPLPPPAARVAAPPTGPSSGTVLVVDDTPANVHLLTELLQRQGLRVLEAINGDQGIALAQRFRPDVILLDVRMRGLGGFETCGVLKADPRTQAIPVIFMTVISDTAAKVAAFEAGASDYVTKPFHVDEALARINTQLRLVESQKQLARLNAELEGRVRERTAQLEAANRELQAICYSMAHDLRGPLGALDGFAALLTEHLQGMDDTRALHYLSRIRSGVKQMDALTEALLNLAHLSLQEPKEESVDLGDLAAQALQRRLEQEPQRHVQIELAPDLVVRADRGQMALLVEHLVDNAWKFTANVPGARLAVGRAPSTLGEAVFFVRDNGAGFDMAYADKLFKPFQRLHAVSEFPGVGIGLAIAERIVSRGGGRIWAESAPGQGATFYFTLAR
jgi:two-component system sensor histidine kinase/response regulator